MPVYYPGYYPSYYQPQQPMQQTLQQQPQDIQNGGFVSVPNEEIVNSYPVAPGKCVTFKIEGQPIVMEKSMGFSQFESPRVDRYRLVKEEALTHEEVPTESPKDNEELKKLKESLKMTDDDIEELREDIKSLWGEIDVLKQQKRSVNTKRDKNGDD